MSTTVLAELHDEMAQILLAKLREGSISASEMRVALDLLKHNDISADNSNEALAALADVVVDMPNLREVDLDG